MPRKIAVDEVSTDAAAIYEITANVLGYLESGEWTALALEMDLRGYGATFEEAIRDLMDLVRMQVSFAHFKDQPEMVLKPAAPVWWERYAAVRQDYLDAMIRERKRAETSFSIAGIRIPPPYAIANFSQAEV